MIGVKIRSLRSSHIHKWVASKPYVSSKSIEIEFTDEDGIVTMLPLSIFEKYLEGKLINDEDDQVMRPIKYI